MVGDSLHNFIDGLVIAASFIVSVPLGIAATIAVVLHEIPQEIGQFAILIHGGWTKGKALLYNFVSALTSVLGALIVLIFAKQIEAPQLLLSFAGASFIYLSMSDIIPELHKEKSPIKSFWQIISFVIGVAMMALLLKLE
jgi:zinc and cadmium transporter